MKMFQTIKKTLSVMLALILMIFAIIPTGAVSLTKYQIPKTKEELLSAYSRYLSLYDYMVEELKYRGYTDEEIKSIDRIDFQEISQKWKLKEVDIANILEMYPQWKDVDLSNWTYEQYELYSSAYENSKLLPDEKTKEKLLNIGIKEKYLLQIAVTDFDVSYENMLSSSNDDLMKIQNAYIERDRLWAEFDAWRHKVHDLYEDYLKTSKAADEIIMANRSGIPGIDFPAVLPQDYVQISNFPFRPGSNYYLNGLGYDNPTTRTAYQNASMSIFWDTAGTYTTYGFTNLWGEYSDSTYGPHEGLDFVLAYQQSENTRRSMSVYPLGIFYNYPAKVIAAKSSEGRVALYSLSGGFTAIYRHMVINSAIPQINDLHQDNEEIDWSVFNAIGTQSDVSASDNIHVHFAVMAGKNSQESNAADGILKSINPYNYA